MQRHGSRGGNVATRFRAAGVLLLAVHLLLVGWLTLRPLDVPWMSAANLQPLAGIKADLALGPEAAVRSLGRELLLLAPLGVLLPMVGGRLQVSPLASLTRTVAAGALLSLGIALAQTGVPGQVVDVDSLFLNTVGVALAHLAVVPAARARLRRRVRVGHRVRDRVGDRVRGGVGEVGMRRLSVPPRDEAASQGSTPTIPRVGIAP
ncbi:VanZ family protein [Streptomyces apocyni]|uniref:VanZ family protein n=1 Tax=Streptomyces apocyni TaxID=2654677 RepID=UPI0012EAD41B|nr:VanZ family protein [Streptomyces apocyni]